MRLIVESSRTDPEPAALAIPITPESRTGRVAMARSENELSFWVFCDVADVWFDGVERMLENPSCSLETRLRMGYTRAVSVVDLDP